MAVIHPPHGVANDRECVALRPATVADECFLFGLYASTRQVELAATGWDERAKGAFLRMQFAAQRRSYGADYPRASFDVIIVAGRPAGRLCVDRDADAIHVIEIALLPEFRDRGVGTQILEGLLEEGAAVGRLVSLRVERDNRARRLYERLGFQLARDGEVYLGLEWVPPSRRYANTAS
ncbi:MAG TPA: GNAT family N-acetyltransferase [Solirubrobacteraceae bacterium]|jgi:ribosomal protein S18 acetylase RimI-like enzyme|nr:GNAT family N-acetyltransferase [Solirubrobacteraceae bacterium]